MPRIYKRVTTINCWTECDLKKAIEDIHINKMFIRAAGRKYNIPESTIRKRIKEGTTHHGKLGRRPVFNDMQEKQLEKIILQCASNYHGLTPIRLRRVVYDFAEDNKIKHNFNKSTKLAGKDWLYLFLKRNPTITLRQPEGTSINRIASFNIEELKRFYSNLEAVNEQYSFSPHRIFNMDETGISTVQKKCPKVYGQKGAKKIGAAISYERGRTTTVICCMSATGQYIPPMFIYPRKRLNAQLQQNGPTGSLYHCSKNGWTNEELYIEWLRHFKYHVKPSGEDPVLLVLDNHSSHVSFNAYNFCNENGIIVVTLPPHTSHRTQPLDVTLFGPLKNELNRTYEKYLSSSKNLRITEYDLAALFNKSYLKVATPDKSTSGFRAAGIFPFNPNIFTEEDFPSLLINQNNINEMTNSPKSVNLEEQSSFNEPSTSVICQQNITSHITNKSPPRKCKDASTIPVKKTIKMKAKASAKKQSEIFTACSRKKLLEIAYEKQLIKKNKSTKPIPRKMLKKIEEPKNYLCTVCGEVGKDKEMWYRCTICLYWDHKECTDADTPKNFICHDCR